MLITLNTTGLKNLYKDLEGNYSNYYDKITSLLDHGYDWKESDNGYFIKIKLPGYSKKDISVKTIDDEVIINATNEEYGDKEVSLSLPEDSINFDKINAKLENGILKISLEYKEDAHKEYTVNID